MLIFNIRDYGDFKYLFGLERRDNGEKSRKNKILLNHIKNRALIQYCREHDDWTLINVRNMADLKKQVLKAIQQSGQDDNSLQNKVELIGKTYWSALYRTDELNGLCEDFDKKSVRYINVERGRAFKMKAGKFFSSIINETEIGKILSPSVKNWLSEEFTSDWGTFTYGRTPEVHLHVDNDFAKIYSSHYCKDFNGCSCMVGKDRHSFYEEAVDAKAAYITDNKGYVLARAILFTNVIDQDGKTWRLLERQYAKESNEVLKRTLVDLLIQGNYIDGYKQVGAGCSDSRAFVKNDGSSLMDFQFHIDCDLETYDTLSYQDSFKWYNIDSRTAYNFSSVKYNYNLDITESSLDGDDEEDEYDDYDDFHDYGCDQTVCAYYHGNEYRVDVDNLDEFIKVGDDYYHKDDVVKCAHCGEYLVKDDSHYNDDAEEYFCNDECEVKWKKENWYYSEYDDDFYPDEDEITTLFTWDSSTGSYKGQTISHSSLSYLIDSDQAFDFGEFGAFDAIDAGSHLPIGYALTKISEHETEHRKLAIA